MSKLWRVGQIEIDYIKKAIDLGLTGVMNQNFEEEFAKKFNMNYSIGVNSGTSALHCSLAAMGVGPGDEVIVPPLTFASTAFSVLYLSAVPIFADIDPDTFNIDPEKIRENITPKTKAIITVAIYGLPPDMDPIMEIARENNLFVLEDCAQCYLGKYKKKFAGTIGDMAIFSFERSKHMTTGNGGMILTDNRDLAENARKFSILGYSTLKAGYYESKPPKDLIQNPNFSRHLLVSPNYRLPEICAAMGLAQLKSLDYFVNIRMKIAGFYEKAINGCEWIKPQMNPQGFKNSYWTFAFKLVNRTWQEFREIYLKNGGDTFYAAWKPTYLEPAIKGMEFKDHNIKYEEGLCPITEKIQPKLVQLKTNYQDLNHAKEQANVLKKTIENLS
jgi:perosamine synthetase